MDISVVGAGRVGTALAVLWRRAGHRILAVAGGAATTERAATHLPGIPVLDDAAAARDAEVVLIATPDDAIAAACAQIAPALRPGAAVIHASGATSLDALGAAADARTLSLHPLQTCPTVESAVERIPGAVFAVTALDEAGFALGERLAFLFGAGVARGDDELAGAHDGVRQHVRPPSHADAGDS